MASNPLKVFDTFNIEPLPFVLGLFALAFWVLSSYIPESLSSAFRIIIILMPVWVPVVLVPVFWDFWLTYIRAKYINSQEHVLLEIRIPREISKSPLAMETLLTNLHTGMGEGTFINRYIEGKTRPWFSLEMVSAGGQVSFYIWTRKFFKDLIEAQLYGQYPTVEVHEASDYASTFHFSNDTHGLWGCDFILSRPDPYPIKTYVDYGLDKDPKEEFKIDPMGGFFEFLSKIGPGEQLWFQILIRVNKDSLREDRKRKKGFFFGTTTSWKEEAKEEIEKIRKEATPERPGSEFPGFPNPTPGQTDQIKALWKSIGKPGFDAGIRGLYIAESDKFNPANIPALTMAFKQLGDNNLNGFKPSRWFTLFNYPWQDYKDRKKKRMRLKMVDAYRRRSWFYAPYKTVPFVLNTEELATIFHFPGSVVQAPSLSRIPSTKGSAPSNIPT